MNDAAQIRHCGGGPSVDFTDAPPGFRPSVRPSSLALPPAYHPAPKNSNREPLRLEINVTHTKQTIAHHSNREAEALFSKRVRAVNRPPRPVREPLRLVRARLLVLSNCEGQSCRIRRRFLPALAAKGMFLHVSLTIRFPHQSIGLPELPVPISNLHSEIRNFQLPQNAKNTKNHPQSLFRLEPTPTLCFQQLTRNLNEPMFRLETVFRSRPG
jgi:hypothetical protein